MTGVFLTIHDDVVGDVDLRLHQRRLLLTTPCPGAPGPSLCVGLDHQRFLALPPLLLLQQCPLWTEQESGTNIPMGQTPNTNLRWTSHLVTQQHSIHFFKPPGPTVGRNILCRSVRQQDQFLLGYMMTQKDFLRI